MVDIPLRHYMPYTHTRDLAELTDLVAANPTRERLVEQLMLALYRSGRRSDALTTRSAWRPARYARTARLSAL